MGWGEGSQGEMKGGHRREEAKRRGSEGGSWTLGFCCTVETNASSHFFLGPSGCFWRQLPQYQASWALCLGEEDRGTGPPELGNRENWPPRRPRALIGYLFPERSPALAPSPLSPASDHRTESQKSGGQDPILTIAISSVATLASTIRTEVEKLSVAKLYPAHQKLSQAKEMLWGGTIGISLGPVSQSPSFLPPLVPPFLLILPPQTDSVCLITPQCPPSIWPCSLDH